MKQKDYMLIGAAMAASLVISLVLANIIFPKPSNLHESVDAVPTISSSLTQPNTNYFNSQSIDPTQLVNIGPVNNGQPFGSGQ